MSAKTAVLPEKPAAASVSGFLEFEKPLVRIQHDIAEMEREQRERSSDLSADIRQQRARFRSTIKRLYARLTPWETVLVARHPKRPLLPDYIAGMFRDYCELHGDRSFGDDRALMTGFARIGRHRVMLVGHNKGRDVKERVVCNFGCAHPEGYRKALAKMKLAEKYGLPVVCLIDTQGAYPGIGSEERGISYAIARNLMEMSRLKTPIVCVVIGEGGSGGALGLGVGDRVAMLRHSFYSVISPEGCAAILWKSAERRQHAAEALKLTAPWLLKLGIIDDVIPEPIGGAHRDPQSTMASVEKYLIESLDHLQRLTSNTILRRRQERIRALGSFYDEPGVAAVSNNGRSATASKPHAPRTARSPRSSRAARLGARVSTPASV